MLSLFRYHVEGRIVLSLGAHVDDVMLAAEPEYESMIYEFLGNFVIKKESVGEFRFCGREYYQEHDYNIRVTCQDNTKISCRSTSSVAYANSRTKLLTEKFRRCAEW